MDFTYSDEQRMLGQSVDRFGEARWSPADRLKRLEDFEASVAQDWAQMAELGWLMIAMPEADGGLGGGPAEVMAAMEAFGRHLLPHPYVASCVLTPALVAGAGEAASELMAGIAAGAVQAAAGLLEADGGYDLAHVATAARRIDGGWRLDGCKSHVEDGAGADWFVVSARTGGGADEPAGISLFLVAKDAPGLTVERFRAVDAHRHARLRLDGVSQVVALGEIDAALPTIERAVDHAIAAHLAEAVGSMEQANLATLDYLRTRQQFGVAIGTFQALRHRAVDMAIAAEEARSMCYRATLQLDGPERRRAVSAAKTRVGQTGLYVARQAVQLHGGVGTSDELVVSHHLRRQMMLEIAYGDAGHHRRRFIQAA